MDIALIRTFLEVRAQGSFAAAAERLFVTQSAVSLRIQRLEDDLGRPLFKRSKAGAELTPAGREFEHYALSLLKLWEEARQQVAIPEGFTESLSIGAQYSLWPRLGFRWLDQLRAERPRLNLRAELGMPDRLTRFLIEGVIQAALTYTPQIRPGLSVDQVLDEELVLVAPWADAREITSDNYVFVDWGPEFVQAHAMHLPHLTNTGMTLSLGAMAVDFIRTRQRAAYLPVRAVKPLIDRGELFLIADAPIFPYPAWVVWRDDLPTGVREVASQTLKTVVATAETEQSSVLEQLDEISKDEIETLGSA